MKKVLLGAFGLLALASCSDDELTGVNRDGDEIAFSVVTNPVSRASDIYCNNHNPTQFTVWAKHNNQQYIDGDVIKFNATTNKWENNSGNRYWPAGDVTFFAFCNDGGKFSYNTGNLQIVDFEVNADVAQQTDLIYAVKTQSKAATGTQPLVELNFRHALSQIVFQAKNTNKNLYVEISGVSICKVNNKGTFAFPSENTDANIDGHSGTTPSITDANHGWGNWTSLSGANTYAVDFTAKPVAFTDDDTKQIVSLTNTNDKSDGAAEFSSNAMLLLPQSSEAWSIVTGHTSKPGEQNGTYFLVDCVIYNVSNHTGTFDKTKEVCLWGNADGTAKPVAIPVKLAWEQGKKYVYTFAFGNGNGGYDPETGDPILVPITFDVKVDEFVPVDNEDVVMDKPAESTPAP